MNEITWMADSEFQRFKNWINNIHEEITRFWLADIVTYTDWL